MIGADVTIGGTIVSEDVISVETSQVSGLQEGVEPSKVTIKLHNGGNKYGNMIAGLQWPPRQAVITALCWNQLMGRGNPYYSVLFLGVLVKTEFNEEFCTVSGECVASMLADAASKDFVFNTSDTLISSAQQIIDDGNSRLVGYTVNLVDKTNSETDRLYILTKASGTKSTSENLQKLVNDHQRLFYAPTDDYPMMGGIDLNELGKEAGGPSTSSTPGAVPINQFAIVMYDLGYVSGGVYNLDPYVLDPGNGSSIPGYCNQVRVHVVGNESLTGSDWDLINPRMYETSLIVPDSYYPVGSINDKGYLIDPKTEPTTEDPMIKMWSASIMAERTVYGLITAPDVKLAAPDIENAKKMAMKALFAYVTQKNRDIEVTVANIVPPLLSLVNWTIPDMSGAHHHGLAVQMQVQKKRVTYSDKGIITVLTCRPPFGNEPADGTSAVTTTAPGSWKDSGGINPWSVLFWGPGAFLQPAATYIWNGVLAARDTNGVQLAVYPTGAAYTPEGGMPGP